MSYFLGNHSNQLLFKEAVVLSQDRERNARMDTSCLQSFLNFDRLPKGENQKRWILNTPIIREVRIFALGPEGTNISQASRKWARRMGISHKTSVSLWETPEICLEEAKKVEEDGVLAVFWTCAVYGENEFFFANPDVLPFFFEEVMNLNEMQLACNGRSSSQKWRIASHPLSALLLKGLDCEVVITNSNSAAAELCKKGEVDACITTEQARNIYGLQRLHSFGSPPMVFFGGITAEGAELMSSAYLFKDHFSVRTEAYD